MTDLLTRWPLAAGIYADVSAANYHDKIITPEPPLSAGLAIKIMGKCPARAWYDSPMNPLYEPTQKPEFDIGRAAHLLFLEPAEFSGATVVIDAADYRKDVNKAARLAAYDAGKTPLLPDQLDMIKNMQLAMFNKLADLPFDTAPRFAADGFSGKTEQSMFWRDSRFGVWCKARPDVIMSDTIMVDYKSSHTADPRQLDRTSWDLGWHQRAAWYIDGYREITGSDAQYWYIVQEKEPPHLTTVCFLPGELIDMGRQLNRKAAHVYATCLGTGRWPSYRSPRAPDRDQAHMISVPQWAAHSFEIMKEAGGLSIPKLAAAAHAQRPLGVE